MQHVHCRDKVKCANIMPISELSTESLRHFCIEHRTRVHHVTEGGGGGGGDTERFTISTLWGEDAYSSRGS